MSTITSNEPAQRARRCLSIEQSLGRLLSQMESDRSLLRPAQVKARLEALHLLDRYTGAFSESEHELVRRARELHYRMEQVNAEFYRVVRRRIRANARTPALAHWMKEAQSPSRETGYDYLDEMVSDILRFEAPQDVPLPRDPEKLFYQPTPVRHIFRLLYLTSLTADDLLVDLGSGLGHVPMLTTLCTRARALGVESERAYVDSARAAACDLRLNQVTFLHQDAREVDMSRGTVFYLYTPFVGSILRRVLDRMRNEAHRRTFRIACYGPCTSIVAGESWLTPDSALDAEAITIFRSRS